MLCGLRMMPRLPLVHQFSLHSLIPYRYLWVFLKPYIWHVDGGPLGTLTLHPFVEASVQRHCPIWDFFESPAASSDLKLQHPQASQNVKVDSLYPFWKFPSHKTS